MPRSGVTNHHAGVLREVTAEITSVSPPDYAGYEHPFGTGHDSAALPDGLNRPTDARGGLFHHGDIDPATRSDLQWTFRNPGGSFVFYGRIMAQMLELLDGVDDNCDGWVDDRLGQYADGVACRFDDDCVSGRCHDVDSGVVPEPVGDCAQSCPEGQFGDPCEDCPGGPGAAQCSGNGVCDDGSMGSGACSCFAGFAGTACDDCAPGFWGPTCAGCPLCENGGSCRDGLSGDGTCVCPADTHGTRCEHACFDGIQSGDETGPDCGGATCAPCRPPFAHRTYTVEYDGYVYATMDDAWPLDGTTIRCHACWNVGPVPIPTGWEIAPDTPEVRALMTVHNFSTHVVAIDWADPGTGYHDIKTSNSPPAGSEFICCGYTAEGWYAANVVHDAGAGTYCFQVCSRRMLIRRPL